MVILLLLLFVIGFYILIMLSVGQSNNTKLIEKNFKMLIEIKESLKDQNKVL